jgi:hypothetical protein
MCEIIPDALQPAEGLVRLFTLLELRTWKTGEQILNLPLNSSERALAEERPFVCPSVGCHFFSDKVYESFESEEAAQQALNSEVIGANVRMLDRRGAESALRCSPKDLV